MTLNINPTQQFIPVAASRPIPNQPFQNVAFFDTSGNPLIFNNVPLGSAVKLTGYTPPSGSNVLATDSVTAAIQKLDARMRAAGTPI